MFVMFVFDITNNNLKEIKTKPQISFAVYKTSFVICWMKHVFTNFGLLFSYSNLIMQLVITCIGIFQINLI